MVEIIYTFKSPENQLSIPIYIPLEGYSSQEKQEIINALNQGGDLEGALTEVLISRIKQLNAV
ncbi:MAG: hypothetical protein ACP5D2_02595 [Candidatus Nanoarchaeia archaeon]